MLAAQPIVRAAGLLPEGLEADYRVLAVMLGVLMILITFHLLRREGE